jgi:hypothetical protein
MDELPGDTSSERENAGLALASARAARINVAIDSDAPFPGD